MQLLPSRVVIRGGLFAVVSLPSDEEQLCSWAGQGSSFVSSLGISSGRGGAGDPSLAGCRRYGCSEGSRQAEHPHLRFPVL